MYLARLLKPLGIRITRLASGLPVGGDLEYADELTLGRASRAAGTSRADRPERRSARARRCAVEARAELAHGEGPSHWCSPMNNTTSRKKIAPGSPSWPAVGHEPRFALEAEEPVVPRGLPMAARADGPLQLAEGGARRHGRRLPNPGCAQTPTRRNSSRIRARPVCPRHTGGRGAHRTDSPPVAAAPREDPDRPAQGGGTTTAHSPLGHTRRQRPRRPPRTRRRRTRLAAETFPSSCCPRTRCERSRPRASCGSRPRATDPGLRPCPLQRSPKRSWPPSAASTTRSLDDGGRAQPHGP